MSLLKERGLFFRCKKVQLTGLDQNGDEVKWSPSGWAARIAQHEFDHLNGKMFIDRAPVETLTFDYWNIVNSRLGEFKLSYGGIGVTNSELSCFEFYLTFSRVVQENGSPVAGF